MVWTCLSWCAVGYGDVTPRSQIARAVVICLIFFFLAFIPYQIGQTPHHPLLPLSTASPPA